MQINIKYLDNNCPKIKKIDKGDWIDLRVISIKINGEIIEWNNNDEVSYKKDDFILIQTGVAMELPNGYEGHIAPRGSTFKKFGLIQTNSVGVVDETYCGDNDYWFIPMYALKNGKINKYDRVVQFRIIEKMKNINFVECETLNNKDRGGHGSTGHN